MAENCEDAQVPENLDFCPNEENAPGISEVELYFAVISDFDVIETVPKLSEGANYEALGTIAAAHTFKADKGFHKVYVKPDTGLIDGAQAGEKGGLSITNNFGGVIPSTGAKTGGWLRKHLNRPMIVLVTERSGLVKQIGSKYSPAYMTEVTPTSGQKPGDATGVTIKVSDSTGSIAPVYAGAITQFTPPAEPVV